MFSLLILERKISNIINDLTLLGKSVFLSFLLFFSYLKSNFFRSWFQRPRDDCIETEMWKHSDSEVDLCSQQEGSDRQYSSDITLCVNPDFRMTSE